ncbi:hypothetical protein [Roseisolibacter sp. H3M3-2]|uniref:hypothetical protein n=1 Tax=Roseisolibacter sp. H3M3-2 TaxID=3031323 RepID=UPI0023DA9816|nr:hypothetical protein [Roseisolibacter sp. H3M3-2]MDF1502963.1 hypothetical protein [Roseisolibacter sp. H3M3-2]
MPRPMLMALLLAACAEPPRAEAPPPTSAPAQPPRARVAVDAEGVRLIDTAGAARPLAFGAPAAQAVDDVTAAVGAPLRREENQDCGAGRLDVVTFAGGLQLLVQGGKFVGWSTAAPLEVAPAPGTMPRTMAGIGVGSTRAALESVYAATVDSTTLGVEFEAGGLQGVFDSPAADAPIVAMWAGAACVAR